MLGPRGTKQTVVFLFLSTVVINEVVLICFQIAVSYTPDQPPGHAFHVVSPSHASVSSSNISSYVAVREYGFRSVLPVHYINLDRSIDRKNYTEDVFKRNNNQISRIPAINKNDVDEHVEGGKSRPGEKCLFASHLKALMTGFHLNMSMILDSSNNSSDKEAIPKLSKKIRSKGDYDNIMIFEDDASSFPGMLYSSPWAIERLARSLDQKETKWRVAQTQLAFMEGLTWGIFADEISTFKVARKLKNIGRNISTPMSGNSSVTEMPNKRKDKIFRKRFKFRAWGAVANMYSRNALDILNWPLNKTSHRWVCKGEECIADEIFPHAIWSTPPLMTYKLGEGSTGVRLNTTKERRRNDQTGFHSFTIQNSQSWTALLHDAKSTPRVISVENSSLHPIGPTPTWDRYRNCSFGFHPT